MRRNDIHRVIYTISGHRPMGIRQLLHLPLAFHRDARIRLLLACMIGWLSLMAHGAWGQTTTASVPLRLVVLDDAGKPVQGFTIDKLRATINRAPAIVLSADPYAGWSSQPHDDRLLVLFPPMKAHELASRAKSLSKNLPKLANMEFWILTPDAKVIDGLSDPRSVESALQRFTEKNNPVTDYERWLGPARDAIRGIAKATGRCVILLNTTSHTPPQPKRGDVTATSSQESPRGNELSALARDEGCELYLTKDSEDMPSEIPATIQQLRRGQALDGTGQLQDVLPGIGNSALSLTGEEVTYSIGDAVNHILRDVSGVYRLSLQPPTICPSNLCHLTLSGIPGVTLLYPTTFTPSGSVPFAAQTISHNQDQLKTGFWIIPYAHDKAEVIVSASRNSGSTPAVNTLDAQILSVGETGSTAPLMHWHGTQRQNIAGEQTPWFGEAELAPGEYAYRVSITSTDGSVSAPSLLKFRILEDGQSTAVVGSLILASQCVAQPAIIASHDNAISPLFNGKCQYVPDIAPILRPTTKMTLLVPILFIDTKIPQFPTGWTTKVGIVREGQVLYETTSSFRAYGEGLWSAEGTLALPSTPPIKSGPAFCELEVTGPEKQHFARSQNCLIESDHQ